MKITKSIYFLGAVAALIWSRTGLNANDITLTDGKGGGQHYTSFPVSIGLSTTADITAKNSKRGVL